MKAIALLALLLVLQCLILATQGANWSVVDEALQKGISTKAYPGCVAIVGNEKGVLYFKAFGNYTYGAPTPLNGGNPPMTKETIFDMASCSKVTAATTAMMQFYERGEIDLDTKVSALLGDDFSQNGKADITVRNCLLHNTGFPPDPNPNYWEKSFGCPETSQPLPAENFSCQQKTYNSLMAQTLENPVGSTYVYSDLSFITLMHIVGHLARQYGYVRPSELIPTCKNNAHRAITQCYFEAYCRIHVFPQIHMENTGFLLPEKFWKMVAPCENDTYWRSYQNKLLQGQVSDGNAYALGGIAGHAGIFSDAQDIFKLGHRIMFAGNYNDKAHINATTAKYFTTEYNHTQSCRALGWSTNDPTAYDYGWYQACGNLSATTWTHIGYTGTQICGDPERELVTVFLTNRVYPNASNNQMHTYRQAFNNAVLQAMNSFELTNEEAPVIMPIIDLNPQYKRNNN